MLRVSIVFAQIHKYRGEHEANHAQIKKNSKRTRTNKQRPDK
jgi:hypothetical protein